jgi:hypothetical protein
VTKMIRVVNLSIPASNYLEMFRGSANRQFPSLVMQMSAVDKVQRDRADAIAIPRADVDNNVDLAKLGISPSSGMMLEL